MGIKTAIIIHGTYGHPKENWFPWLKEKLESVGYKVEIPQFPTPENQTPQNWFKVFKKYENLLNEESILIGHSYGGSFVLRILEKLKTKISTAVIVAGSVGIKPIKFYEFDLPMIKDGFDWKKIRSNADHFLVFHSEDDPYICVENGENIAKNLDTKLIRHKNSGHFNEKAGYSKFELLLKALK